MARGKWCAVSACLNALACDWRMFRQVGGTGTRVVHVQPLWLSGRPVVIRFGYGPFMGKMSQSWTE